MLSSEVSLHVPCVLGPVGSLSEFLTLLQNETIDKVDNKDVCVDVAVGVVLQ